MSQFRVILLTGVLTSAAILFVNPIAVPSEVPLVPDVTSPVCLFNTLCQFTDVPCNVLCELGGYTMDSCTLGHNSTWMGGSCVCTGTGNPSLLNVTTTLNIVCAGACTEVCVSCGFFNGVCSNTADGLGVNCDCSNQLSIPSLG